MRKIKKNIISSHLRDYAGYTGGGIDPSEYDGTIAHARASKASTDIRYGKTGIGVYENLLRMPVVKSLWQARVSPVISRNPVFLDGANPNEMNDVLKEEMENWSKKNDIRGIYSKLSKSIITGISIIELYGKKSDVKWVEVPSWQIIKTRTNETYIAKNAGSYQTDEGRKLDDAWKVEHKFGSATAPYGDGLGSSIESSVNMINGLHNSLMQNTLEGASGGIIIKTPDSDDATIDLANAAINDFLQFKGASIPKEFEIIYPSGRGGQLNIDHVLNHIASLEKLLAVTILGEDLTTNMSNGGSYAAGEVADVISNRLSRSDAASICNTINEQLFVPMMLARYPFLEESNIPRLTFTFGENEEKEEVEEVVDESDEVDNTEVIDDNETEE